MLDQFGKIAAAEIVFYVPLLFITFIIALRHGFSRRAGWIFLFIFCLIRAIGAAITVVWKSSSTPQTGLIVAATVLSGIGLSPLLFATLGFVTNIAQNGLLLSPPALRLTRVLLAVALLLGTIGGTSESPSNSASTISTGRTLIRVSTALFMAAFIILFWLHVVLWGARHNLSTRHRNLLAGVSMVLPPLLVRIVYGLLGAYASSTTSRWSSISGDWKIYLTMGLSMEFLAVVTYVVVGLVIPVEGYEEAAVKEEDAYQMGYRV